MIMKYFKYLILILLGLYSSVVIAQNALIKEEVFPLKTYPFTDPNIVPEPGRIYPFFRFDGYTNEGVVQPWKMIVLENKYIKLWVVPQIGGKIWGAIEKSTGREFIYFNHVVKFRDVAMRGPWTSGGLEFNFGIIGHGPSCATPVDCMTRTNADGSVSCFIGQLDLPSRTRWMVEINLQKDKAYFTTRSVWDNPTALEQSYYHWTNLGIKSNGNLEYIFPGNKYIGHDGKSSSWPIDENGRDIHFYENNNFGTYKSYHVLGELTDFYGGFWHNDNFGVGHYSTYDDKPGKKIWIWGLSEQGMNWEKLLTDSDGQYTELQSGRLFNQANEVSSKTPFKNRSFTAGSTDEWTEYWFPVKQTYGLKSAVPEGSINMQQQGDTLHLWFCPNEKIDEKLAIKDGDKIIFQRDIHCDPMEIISESFKKNGNVQSLSLWIGKKKLFDINPEKSELKRPVESPAEFNWETAYGYYLKGKELERQRLYKRAEEEYLKSLESDSYFVPSLKGMANITYRKADYQTAQKYAVTALSVDAYDAGANMIYGLIGLAKRDTVSAIDGFSIASADISQRCTAYNSLASIYVSKGDFQRANEYAEKSLQFNQLSTEARQMKILTLRKLGIFEQLEFELNKLELNDPLNHFIRFERYLRVPSESNLEQLKKYINNEFSFETYLEIALWYYRNNQKEDALKVLDCAPQNQPFILFWKGYIYHLTGQEQKASDVLKSALNIGPKFVFPFRIETLSVLEWAMSETDDWKVKYYAGLIYLNAGSSEKCLELLKSCSDKPDFYPFYVVRSRLWNPGSIDSQNDAEKVLELAANDWRAGLFVSKFYLGCENYQKADEIARNYYLKNSQNYYLGLHYAKILELNKNYSACIDILREIWVLPNEGATEGRKVWRNANIGKALDYFEVKEYKKAIESINTSKKWPVNLGVGKPYFVDERLEDFILLQCYKKINDNQSVKQMSDRIISMPLQEITSVETNYFLTAWMLKEIGDITRGDSTMQNLLEKNPSSRSIQWCKAIYTGDFQNAQICAAEVGNSDQIFNYLKRIFDLILTK
jgi:hypothetical protein